MGVWNGLKNGAFDLLTLVQPIVEVRPRKDTKVPLVEEPLPDPKETVVPPGGTENRSDEALINVAVLE